MGYSTFSVRIEDETKKKLEKLANSIKRTRNYVIKEALEEYIAVNELQIFEIKKAVKKADNADAEWLDHDDVKKKWEAKLEN